MNAISTFTFLHERLGQASYCQDSIYIANPATLQIIVVLDLKRFILYYPIFCANLDAKLYWVIDQGAGNGVDHATNKCGDLDQKVKAPSEENDKSKAHKLPVLARWN